MAKIIDDATREAAVKLFIQVSGDAEKRLTSKYGTLDAKALKGCVDLGDDAVFDAYGFRIRDLMI